MNRLEKNTTFGVIVATRGIFSPVLAQEGRKQLLAKLDSLGYHYVIPPETATPNGAIETFADAKVCAELFRQNSKEIDGIIITLPNFGDELGVVNTLDLAKLNVPVLIQACDDDLDKVGVATRRDHRHPLRSGVRVGERPRAFDGLRRGDGGEPEQREQQQQQQQRERTAERQVTSW
jgi:L-fucose isomerase-like protein